MLKRKIKNVHKTPPKGKPKSRSQYADPKNLKWPIDAKHIRAAVSYFNHGNKSNYSSSQWATIGRRIAAAANRLISKGHAFANGKIKTAGATAEYETAYQQVSPLALAKVFTLIARSAIEGHAYDGLHFSIEELREVLDDEDEADGEQDDEDDDAEGEPPARATEEAGTYAVFADLPAHLLEEIAVNGEPCFQYESMVIPADAVSKNTIPGKRGPTYYSARRIRQYVDDNNHLIEELGSRNQHVTIYPRHMAAMLETTLPLGWVESYFTRPSESKAGCEDAWYRATVPLSTAGKDLRTSLRTGLVKYSSLRSQEAPAFQTQPVKVNGRLVEEAVKLPIVGIDLVATAPGLPVAPIRVLEEAASSVLEGSVTIDESVEPEPTPVSPPSPITTPPSREGQRSMKKYLSAKGEDISDVVEAAIKKALATEESRRKAVEAERDTLHEQIERYRSSGSGSGAGEESGQGGAGAGASEEMAARLDELEQVASAEKQRRKALEREIAELKKGSGASEEVSHKLEVLEAKNAALEEQIKGYDAIKAQMARYELQTKLEAEVDRICAEDATMGGMMKPVIMEELKTHPVDDLAKVEALYWKVRAKHNDRLMSARSRMPAGFGFVNVPGAEEEETPPSGGGDGNGASGAGANKNIRVNERQMAVLRVAQGMH